MNQLEIAKVADALQPLVGHQLQDVVVAERACGLGFWTNSGRVWLWVDLNPWFPLVLPLNEAPEPGVKPLRPLALFLRAHGVGQRLKRVRPLSDLGRALELVFGEDALIVTLHLWPHGQNVVVQAGTKRVLWRRIAKPEVTSSVESQATYVPSAVRELPEILSDWLSWRAQGQKGGSVKSAGAKNSPPPREEQRKNEKARLERALEKVNGALEKLGENLWRQAGDYLVSAQSLEVPAALSALVDRRRSLAWNIDQCFARAKEHEQKRLGALSRRERLEGELKLIETGQWSPAERSATQRSRAAKGRGTKAGDRARYRTVELPQGLIARVGRSAADNLALLRSAQPWDLWLHLRDHPGSHGIVTRGRDQAVGDAALIQVGQALVEATFGAKSALKQGLTFALLVAECRHVRPIKGDRLGRVTHQNSRTLQFRF